MLRKIVILASLLSVFLPVMAQVVCSERGKFLERPSKGHEEGRAAWDSPPTAVSLRFLRPTRARGRSSSPIRLANHASSRQARRGRACRSWPPGNPPPDHRDHVSTVQLNQPKTARGG